MDKAKLIESAEQRIEEIDIGELMKEGLICLDGQFFPSVHYPPITMYPPISEKSLFTGYSNPEDNLFVVYAHIPFCARHCAFCHYPIMVGNSSEDKDFYLRMLMREIDLYVDRLGVSKIRARSVLVGGGTPTFLTLFQLNNFFLSFMSRIDLTLCTQFNYDVDPATLLGEEGCERLRIMKSYGVSRLTIGVQSFNNKILKIMNRHHSAKDAIEAIAQAKQAGFKVCVEFIYGYPGQSIGIWIETLRKAVSLGVDEIQIYRLKIIPYGDYAGSVTKKFISRSADFADLKQTMLMKMLANIMFPRFGYSENLTRVFSRCPEDFSHYASDQCCNLFDQIGFGLTAFSSLRDRFGLNTQNIKEYYDLISRGRLPFNRGLVRGSDDQMRWAVILPLKNRRVYRNHYQRIANVSLENVFLKKKEVLNEFDLIRENDKTLTLTDRGRFFADEVCQQFHHPDYMPFRKAAYSLGRLNPYVNF